MAPIRRYLRITKHSVLEVRIYLDHPSDAETWLLRPGNPALPRVIQAVRPRVLPKLREENERVRGKGKSKKKSVKDVVVEEDFEVAVFLTELSSRHSVLTKHKSFKDHPRIQSNSGKLTGWLTTGTKDEPVLVSDDSNVPILIRDEDPDETINLLDIPEAPVDDDDSTTSDASKRRKKPADVGTVSNIHDANDSDARPAKRRRRLSNSFGEDSEDRDALEDQDDKKLHMRTSYDGFSIYGRILCLVVKRKDDRRSSGGMSGTPATSQKMLENWVSTQAAAQQGDDDEDDNG